MSFQVMAELPSILTSQLLKIKGKCFNWRSPVTTANLAAPQMGSSRTRRPLESQLEGPTPQSQQMAGAQRASKKKAKHRGLSTARS